MFLLGTTLVKFLLIIVFVLSLAAVLTWMERRQSAYSQDRLGPQRAEIRLFGRAWRFFGLLHPLADALKMLFKEPFIPARADRFLYRLAPLVGFTIALSVMALVPFGPDLAIYDLPGAGRLFSDATLRSHPSIPLQVARLDAGLLFFFAISGFAVFGAALGGWASNNRFALLGGLRAAAQAVSYEVALGLTTIGVLIAFGTTELSALVSRQGALLFAGVPAWGIAVQPFAAMLFFVAAIAETKRGPFDLPEGESEIIGYFVEYSSMSFGLFMLSEFMEVIVVASIFTTLFLGGWQLPWVFGQSSWNLGVWAGRPDFFGLAPGFWTAAAGVLVFGFKVFVISALQLQVRWTLPRFRYDQLMRLAWQGLLPLALANIVFTAGFVLFDPSLRALSAAGFAGVVVLVGVALLGPHPSRSVAVAGAHPSPSRGES
jgi:NADH-quinone oxidoreductase subunit H